MIPLQLQQFHISHWRNSFLKNVFLLQHIGTAFLIGYGSRRISPIANLSIFRSRKTCCKTCALIFESTVVSAFFVENK